MGVINLAPYKPVPGTVGDANAIANAFTTLEATLNGGIDNNNFAGGKIFDPAKLMQSGATALQVLAWDTGTATWKPTTLAGLSVISDQTLGAPAAGISFTSIPQTFKSLHLMIASGSSLASTADDILLRINGAVAGYYSNYWQTAGAAGSGGESLAASSLFAGIQPASTADNAAINFGLASIWLHNYTAAKQHTFRSVSHAYWNTTAGSRANRDCGGYGRLAANPITQLDLLCGANFITGSRFTLYGVG